MIFNDRELFLMDHTKEICLPPVSKQSSIKKSVDKKRSRSHRRETVVDNIWSRVSTALKLKENGFLSTTIMVCLQQNEPHSLPIGNPDNIHEADSTEKHWHEKQIPAGLFTFFH